MNFYSHDAFIGAFARAYFPGQKVTGSHFSVAGKTWRLPTLEGNRPIAGWAFIDFFNPLEDAPSSAPLGLPKSSNSALAKADRSPLRYLPKASHGKVRVEEWLEKKLDQTYEPAPLIDWSEFANWEAFTRFVGTRRSSLFADSRRQKRRLEKDLGALTFVFNDPRPEVFRACLQWKSSQYLASGYSDLFANPRHVALFKELAEAGILVVSSLQAGTTLLAVHLGALCENKLYSWIPAYDPAYGNYSPGRLMLESLIEESHRLGHDEFDFLIGEESYKWHYATHTRLIGELGTPPLVLRMQRTGKAWLKAAVAKYPGVLKGLKKLRKKFKDKLKAS